MHVASAAVSSACNDEPLAGVVEVVQQFVRLGIVDQRAGRELQDEVFASPARALAALALPPVLGALLRLEAEMGQGVHAAGGLQNDTAAVAAVAARGPALGDELLAAERDAAVSALARADLDLCFVDKHCTVAILPA